MTLQVNRPLPREGRGLPEGRQCEREGGREGRGRREDGGGEVIHIAVAIQVKLYSV